MYSPRASASVMSAATAVHTWRALQFLLGDTLTSGRRWPATKLDLLLMVLLLHCCCKAILALIVASVSPVMPHLSSSAL